MTVWLLYGELAKQDWPRTNRARVEDTSFSSSPVHEASPVNATSANAQLARRVTGRRGLVRFCSDGNTSARRRAELATPVLRSGTSPNPEALLRQDALRFDGADWTTTPLRFHCYPSAVVASDAARPASLGPLHPACSAPTWRTLPSPLLSWRRCGTSPSCGHMRRSSSCCSKASSTCVSYLSLTWSARRLTAAPLFAGHLCRSRLGIPQEVPSTRRRAAIPAGLRGRPARRVDSLSRVVRCSTFSGIFVHGCN